LRTAIPNYLNVARDGDRIIFLFEQSNDGIGNISVTTML
jgi:hypothetical protein